MPEQVCSGIFYIRRFLKQSASWKFYIIAEAKNPEAALRKNITRNIKDGTELKRPRSHSPTSHYTTLRCSKLHTPRHSTVRHEFARHCTARRYTAWHCSPRRSIGRLTLRDVVPNDIARHYIAQHRNAWRRATWFCTARHYSDVTSHCFSLHRLRSNYPIFA